MTMRYINVKHARQSIKVGGRVSCKFFGGTTSDFVRKVEERWRGITES